MNPYILAYILCEGMLPGHSDDDECYRLVMGSIIWREE